MTSPGITKMQSLSDRKHLISATALVPAEARRVYAVIADYHNGHPHAFRRNLAAWWWKGRNRKRNDHPFSDEHVQKEEDVSSSDM